MMTLQKSAAMERGCAEIMRMLASQPLLKEVRIRSPKNGQAHLCFFAGSQSLAPENLKLLELSSDVFRKIENTNEYINFYFNNNFLSSELQNSFGIHLNIKQINTIEQNLDIKNRSTKEIFSPLLYTCLKLIELIKRFADDDVALKCPCAEAGADLLWKVFVLLEESNPKLKKHYTDIVIDGLKPMLLGLSLKDAPFVHDNYGLFVAALFALG